MKTSEYVHAVIGSCRTYEQALLVRSWIRSIPPKKFDDNKVEAYFQKKSAGDYAYSKAWSLMNEGEEDFTFLDITKEGNTP